MALNHPTSRRDLLRAAAAGAAWAASAPLARALAAPEGRPNILWVVCEDINPNLGCCGDAYADTPNLDRLAARGMLYRNVWSNAPVCAPARTTIITGVYPTATGSEHMRCMSPLPASVRMFPQLLREAGYYCTNNAKEDYNLRKPAGVWDESSRRAHWRNRPAGQPFFAVFNHEITHESQIRARGHRLVHDPAKARIPAYEPDTPECRHDWAQYYDNITTMDGQIAAKLKELEDAGLAEDTIVFFYGDNGSGMPRCKRTACDSGNRVPMIVYFPEKWRHLAPKEYQPGAKTDRLAAFVDLAPTVLSLAGIRPPAYMQGSAFLGRYEAPEPAYLYGFRGRMDERYDMVRSIRDRRYVYVRNYMPHLPHGQHVSYQFETPTTRAWKQLFDEGKLPPEQARFWLPKEPEELYDLQTDPDEVKNLAASPAHRDVLARMRKAQHDLALQIRDVGILPESEMHRRSAGSTPYDLGRDAARCPLGRIVAAAELASSLKLDAVPALQQALADGDSGVRYWGAMGLLMRGKDGVTPGRDALRKALADESPAVRVAAGQALAQFGSEEDAKEALPQLAELADCIKNGVYVSLAALNALDALGPKAAAALPAIKALPKTPAGRDDQRAGVKVAELANYLAAKLGG